jgi:hypothetical protein
LPGLEVDLVTRSSPFFAPPQDIIEVKTRMLDSASSDGKKKKRKAEDEEEAPAPIVVLTDLLLSLLSRQSALFRDLVAQVRARSLSGFGL